MQLHSCLYANCVGLRFFSITALSWVWYTTFFECSCDRERDVDASVPVNFLVGDNGVGLW